MWKNYNIDDHKSTSVDDVALTLSCGGGVLFEDMVKEYDPTAPAPDWELVPKSPEDGVVDTPPLDAEAVIAERNESIGTGMPSEKEAAEIAALNAQLKGEVAPPNGSESGTENKPEVLFDAAPAKSPERPASQMSKEEVDAAISEMFAEEAKTPEKKSGSTGEMSRGEYSQDEIGELNNFLGGNALSGRPEGLLAERKLKDQESQKKYKWGMVGAGVTTLISGIGASALGYSALGVGLALGAAPVMATCAAVWGIKKGWDGWKRRGAAKKLATIYNDQTIMDQ